MACSKCGNTRLNPSEHWKVKQLMRQITNLNEQLARTQQMVRAHEAALVGLRGVRCPVFCAGGSGLREQCVKDEGHGGKHTCPHGASW